MTLNVTGTLNVLRASIKAGVSRVVIASSCAVYVDAHQPPLKEVDLSAPKSLYIASKLTNETILELFYYKIDWKLYKQELKIYTNTARDS
jgi:nucleoside-diphosphate-sugar epimerase